MKGKPEKKADIKPNKAARLSKKGELSSERTTSAYGPAGAIESAITGGVRHKEGIPSDREAECQHVKRAGSKRQLRVGVTLSMI